MTGTLAWGFMIAVHGTTMDVRDWGFLEDEGLVSLVFSRTRIGGCRVVRRISKTTDQKGVSAPIRLSYSTFCSWVVLLGPFLLVGLGGLFIRRCKQ